MADYVRRHPLSMPRILVADGVSEMIADAEARNLSPCDILPALVSEADGRAWFDLRPVHAPNIIPMAPEAQDPAAARG